MKNDLINLEINDIGTNGEGIGKLDGYTFFVKDALPGDKIEARIVKENKNFGFARLEKIITRSPYRIEPPCEIANRCGGCQIQSLDYEKQLKYKEDKVKNNLERIGGLKDFEMKPIIGMESPYYYRNKSQFPVGKNKEGKIITGFYAGRTHYIIDTTNCHISPKINEEILKTIIDFMTKNGIEAYDEKSCKGIVRHIIIRNSFKFDEIMVIIVVNDNKLEKSEELVNSLKTINGVSSICLNINKDNTNVIMGKKIVSLFGEGYITDYIEDLKFRISPLSFFQINPTQTEKLYRVALKYAMLTGKETVWDLYCGIGSISLFLAKRAKKVFGVEVVKEAIEDAKLNAKINGIENTEFLVGESEKVFVDYYKDKINHEDRLDVVVVDPPRKGCDEKLLDSIIKVSPERIVYVSCDSATLARDLKILCENGYKVTQVQPVDMFPHSVHVETVVRLQRQNP